MERRELDIAISYGMLVEDMASLEPGVRDNGIQIALKTPTRAGIVLYCALRGDSEAKVRKSLGLTSRQLGREVVEIARIIASLRQGINPFPGAGEYPRVTSIIQ